MVLTEVNFHRAVLNAVPGVPGRTGRGDTCTASFLAGRRRGMSLAEATSFAAAVTSEKMRYRGPYRGPSAGPVA